MLGVGPCDGMSRAKHQLGRGATGSDRRDPQSVMCRQHIVRDIGKSGCYWSDFEVPLRAQFSLIFDVFFAGLGYMECTFGTRNKKRVVCRGILRGRDQK